MSVNPGLPPPRNWWSRNWKWLVPTGCLGALLLLAAFIAAIAVIAFSAMKSSDPYASALKRAQSDSRVVAALGTPIRPSWAVSGNVHVENARGDADIEFSIAGPKGNGRVHVVGTKDSGLWTYSTMTVTPEGGGSVIDLLSAP